MHKIAYFISPHGFGHAARACAIMQALHQERHDIEFELFTLVPEWFFAESHLPKYQYRAVRTDLGLVQRNSLVEDIPSTLARLAEFLPFSDHLVNKLAKTIIDLGCRLVLCDIAPLGIAVARTAGLPSVLIENFTWDWIYEGYLEESPEFKTHISYLATWFEQADFHIQSSPVCFPNHPNITTSPVGRLFTEDTLSVRARLGLPEEAQVVLITMGGIESNFVSLLESLSTQEYYFVIPGASDHIVRTGNCIRLPHHSGFYHPDLLRACTAVIGKLGYSTLAEAYCANRPFGFIPRARFRESPPLAEFVTQEMNGMSISEEEFAANLWIHRVPDLLARFQNKPPRSSGAPEAAEFLIKLLD